MLRNLSFDITTLRAGYVSRRFSPLDVAREVWNRIQRQGVRPVWIHLPPEDELFRRAAQLERESPEGKPLYGIPFAIKDNIDWAGAPTTAGCPAFSYTPGETAFAVQQLLDAGAILIGKTNLDQFATGLVGVRSPYGACSSVFDKRYISGGSSSGSGVAVASGLVTFSLGTDTAGSGRVPAAFNNIVGLKPSRGLLSNGGMVPACRTLDCISIFALSCADAEAVFQVAATYDAKDGFARKEGQTVAWGAKSFRFGVPGDEHLEFFGDDAAAELFYDSVRNLESLGGRRVEMDYGPFRQTAQLLYSGPWVAERLAAIRSFAASQAEEMDQVAGGIITGASRLAATDAFEGIYALANLVRQAAEQWRHMDLMLLPTTGTTYTHEAVAAEPVRLNSNLGYYTNFVNLMDLAAIAIPAGFRGASSRNGGLPFGVTLMGPAFSDRALLHLADRLHRKAVDFTGAKLAQLPQLPMLVEPYCPAGYVPVAVVGAHLTGQPLNHQLTSAGAFLLEATRTTPEYRLYSLEGTVPPKPGLVHEPGFAGPGIAVEVWAMPRKTFGAFTAAIPSPLAIGNCTLDSGRSVKGFVCEPFAIGGATEITCHGGWLAYLRSGASLHR